MSGSLLALVTVTATVVAVVVGLAGGLLLAEVRAQDAADAAALAAAHAPRTGAAPHAVAQQVAARHGATLVACECRGATVLVEVRVAVPARAALVTGMRHRRAVAAASLVPAAAPVVGPPDRSVDARPASWPRDRRTLVARSRTVVARRALWIVGPGDRREEHDAAG